MTAGAAQLADTAEVTVGWGEDTHCAECECLLPAGATASPAGDGRLVCVDCTARAEREAA